MDLHKTVLSKRALGIQSPKFGVIAEVRRQMEGLEDVIVLGYGEPDLDTPDFIREAGKKAIDEGFTHYVLPTEGYIPLRQAIAEKLLKQNKIAVNPEKEVLVTSGVQTAINTVILTLVNPGDQVIMPQPYYYSDPLAVILAGGKPVYTQLREENDYRIDFKDLERKITGKTRAFFYISPNCPTGSVFTKEDLERLVEIAKRRKIFMISDEIYEDLVYDGGTNVSIASLPGMKDYAISMFGFSKTFAMTGWRIAYTIGPEEVLGRMKEIHAQLTICPNSIAQKAAHIALSRYENCVREIRTIYEERRNIFIKGLNELGFRCKPPAGSFYVYCNISGFGVTGFELAKRIAREARVVGYPGVAYTEDSSGDPYIRFAYTVSKEKLQVALDRLGVFVRKLPK
jgi:aspartate/methionine/tyrosine aminotransferase